MLSLQRVESLMLEFQVTGKALGRGFPGAPPFLPQKRPLFPPPFSQGGTRRPRIERGPTWPRCSRDLRGRRPGSRRAAPGAPRAVAAGARQRAQRTCFVCREPRLPGSGTPSSHPTASAPHRGITGPASASVWAPSGSAFLGNPAPVVCPLPRRGCATPSTGQPSPPIVLSFPGVACGDGWWSGERGSDPEG